jgi:hypothetical protein
MLSLCIVLIVAGCSGPASVNPTSTTESIQPTQNTTNPVSEETAEPSVNRTFSETGEQTPNETAEAINPEDIQYSNHSNYTKRFIDILDNTSRNVSNLDNQYEGERYDQFELNITDVTIEPTGTDDQNILVVSQELESVSTRTLRRSVGKISIIFATLLKQETVRNSRDWNTTQVRVLTYVDGELQRKNRIEWNWANNWIFYPSWTTETYISNQIAGTTDAYSSADGFGNQETESLKTDIEIESIKTNISKTYINQSGSVIFLTYSTKTPPYTNQADTRINEYELILNEYGELALSENLTKFDHTTMLLEEVYYAPNGSYDTRRMYQIDSSFAKKVYNGTVSKSEIADYLLGNVTIEGDEYYE